MEWEGLAAMQVKVALEVDPTEAREEMPMVKVLVAAVALVAVPFSCVGARKSS